MKVTFMGQNNKVKYSDYVKMTKYMLELLLTPKEINQLTVNLSFERGNPDHVGKKGETFEEEFGEYHIWIRPTMSIREQILTTAHELVHVKQFVRKELCPTTGKILSRSLRKLNPTNSDDYFDNPSEIEANGRAPGLVQRYMRNSS